MKATKLIAIFFAALVSTGAFVVRPHSAIANEPSDTIVVTTTIQAAIDAANPGDEVSIPAGTYVESLVLDKAVSLIGAGSEATIIEAPAGERVLHVRGTAVNENVTISGLTIANGSVGERFFLCPVSCGGGIMLENGASPQMSDLRFLNNRADGRGGGLYADRFSTVHISSSEWIGNEARDYGGGLFAANGATVSESRFFNNESGIAGGGLTVVHTLTLNNSNFVSNTATFYGGAGFVDGDAFIDGSTFSENQSDQRSGGALYIIHSLSLADSNFSANMAGSSGGGIRALSNLIAANTTFTENVANNDGGGLKVDGTATLSNLRFENNVAENGIGGGLAVGAATTMDNSIMLANEAANGGAFYQAGNSETTISNSCVVDNSKTAVFNNGSISLITTNVWWGDASGPSGSGSGDGDSVGPTIDFDNFATAEILGCPHRTGWELHLPIIFRTP